jgi:hypothetical protein
MDSRDARNITPHSPTRTQGSSPATLPLAIGLHLLLVACGGAQESGRVGSAPVSVEEGRAPSPPVPVAVGNGNSQPLSSQPSPATPSTPTLLQRAIDCARSLSDSALKAVIRGERELLVVSGEEKEKAVFSDPDYPDGRDLAILEAVRRGGEDWEGYFSELASSADSCPSLVALTALRRIQGRPDPLEVVVAPAGRVDVTWPDIPQFTITLRNRETSGPPLLIGPENNYRGGFLRAFRFEVVRADGSWVPGRQRWGDFGGALTFTSLKPGATWAKVLDMRDYFGSLDCGVYTARAQYGEDAMFSNSRDIRGRVCYSSEPFTLSVVPRRITLTRVEDRTVRRAIDALPDSRPVRFVVGTPVEDHGDFISAESPEGVLLRTGWKAVPALLDALESRNATSHRRAWALALLFGISGAIDPRPMSVFSGEIEGIGSEDADVAKGGLGGAGEQATSLGESKYSGAAWECLIAGPHSTLGGQGGAFVMSQAGGGGEPSQVAQDWLIGRWKRTRPFLQVEVH